MNCLKKLTKITLYNENTLKKANKNQHKKPKQQAKNLAFNLVCL